MSDESTNGIIAWVVGTSGALVAGLGGIARWVRTIDMRMTTAEATLAVHGEEIEALDDTLRLRSLDLYATRDQTRDNVKDLQTLGGDVKRNGKEIAKLSESHAEIMKALQELLRRTAQ